MLKKLLFLFLVVTVFASTAFSQGTEKTEKELITIAEKNGFTGQLNQSLQNIKSSYQQAVIIEQAGNNNHAVINQNGVDLFAYILQKGNYLKANLTLIGSHNSVVIKQKGNYLTAKVKLAGHYNDLKLLQAGSNLHNNIKLLNVNGMDVMFLQTNTNFYYLQSGMKGNGIALTITTTQSVPTIIVRNH